MKEAGRPLLAWASDHLDFPLPPHHPFPLEKYRLVRERLLCDGVLAPEWVSRSEPVPRAWIAQAHDAHYLERTFDTGWSEAEVRRLGLPWSEALVTRARAALLGTVMASRAALAHGIAGNLAGGTSMCIRETAPPH